jgi:hypothetical protein
MELQGREEGNFERSHHFYCGTDETKAQERIGKGIFLTFRCAFVQHYFDPLMSFGFVFHC